MPTGKPVHRGVTELARQMGVSHSHLSRVLSGKRKPGAGLYASLEALGIRFDRRGHVRPASVRRMAWPKCS